MGFLQNTRLPKYLEDALAPFSWSGILSKEFRNDIVSCIYSTSESREEIIKDFLVSFNTIMFLNAQWKEELRSALIKFGQEGFTGVDNL